MSKPTKRLIHGAVWHISMQRTVEAAMHDPGLVQRMGASWFRQEMHDFEHRIKSRTGQDDPHIPLHAFFVSCLSPGIARMMSHIPDARKETIQ